MSKLIEMAGKYPCVVTNPTAGFFGELNNDKQTPFIRIPCTVKDGDQKGNFITWFGYLSEKAFDNTIKQLAKAFPSWDGDLGRVDDGSFTFAGLECEIDAEVDDFGGKKTIKAAWINAPGGGGKAMDKVKLESLMKKLGRRSKALVTAARKEDGTPSPKAAPTPAKDPVTAPAGDVPPEGDDDIPY